MGLLGHLIREGGRLAAAAVLAAVFSGLIAGQSLAQSLAQSETLPRPSPAPAIAPPAIAPPATPPAAATPTEASTATAFLVAPRLLVTAHHALINRDRVFVGAGRGSKFIRARVVATDERLDLALLEADVAGVPLGIAQWDSVPIGMEVTALGFPRSTGSPGEPRITSGIVNGEHRQRDRNDWFQLSAEVHRGNSGGPVIAVDGSVVGVISHKLDALKTAERINDLPQNVNFALKSQHLIDFLRAQSVTVAVQPLNTTRQIRPFEIFQRNAASVFMVISTRPKDAARTTPAP